MYGCCICTRRTVYLRFIVDNGYWAAINLFWPYQQQQQLHQQKWMGCWIVRLFFSIAFFLLRRNLMLDTWKFLVPVYYNAPRFWITIRNCERFYGRVLALLLISLYTKTIKLMNETVARTQFNQMQSIVAFAISKMNIFSWNYVFVNHSAVLWPLPFNFAQYWVIIAVCDVFVKLNFWSKKKTFNLINSNIYFIQLNFGLYIFFISSPFNRKSMWTLQHIDIIWVAVEH